MISKNLSIFTFGFFLLLFQHVCYAYEFNGLNINGFISQGYLHTNHNDYLADTKCGTFDFNELGLNLGYQASDSIRLGAQILSRNLGVDGNNKLTFGYAYGDYNLNRYLGVRLGKVRIPYGLYNQSRDVDMLRTGVFLPNAIYHDEFYMFFSAFYGVSIYGELPLGNVGSMEYEVYKGKSEEDDESRLVKNNVISFGGENGDLTAGDIYGGVFRWNTPINGLRFGYSYFYMDAKLVIDNVNIIGSVAIDKVKLNPIQVLSAEFTWGDLVLASEFMRFRQDAYIDFSDNTFVPDIGTVITNSEGWYVSASYRYNELIEFGAGYSEFYENTDDKNGGGYAVDFRAWRKDITLSTRFDITDNWVVKAEYHIMDGAAWLPDPGLYSDANSDENIKQKWNMIALKTTFSF